MSMSQSKDHEVATLGGGCFWCLEAVFQQLDGVLSVVSGYEGGHVSHPTYEDVCRGNTGHAEVVRVEFDPTIVSYQEVLEVFFAMHDPSTKNRQGNDVGPQYRSVIFYHSSEQRTQAESVIQALSKQGLWPKKIVTEVSPTAVFYPAEDYHQNYFRSHPSQGYCVAVINPKLAKFRKRFAERLRTT